MDRRKLYKLVAELLPRLGGSEGLLNAAAEAMRYLRDKPNTAVSDSFIDLQPLLHLDDALGRIYQAINAPALEAAYRGTARSGRKFKPSEIPAVTQLFTPKWVVEFLLKNTLGRLWLEMHPDSDLWHGYPARDIQQQPNSTGKMPVQQVKELRICDPACGTMNFGLVAIDMLRKMYREEINHTGQTGWPERPSCADEKEIDTQIIKNNLFGFDIDPVALDLAKQSLEIKIGRAISPDEHHLQRRNTLFDSHIESDFDVIVTNPPYLSARNLDPKVVKRLKKRYPAGWRDLYACLMLRSLKMLRPGGRLGILSMHSFMFTGAFERMRNEIREQANIETVAHFGPGLFDVGNPGTLQTAAVVLQRKPTADCPAVFFQLVDVDDKQAALSEAADSASQFRLSQDELASFPRGAWMYWISQAMGEAFRNLPKLGDIAPPRQGLATTDNARFVRYWWEVEPPKFAGPREKWKMYAKGGRFRRWYESARHRVNWENDGREIKQAIVDRYPYLQGQWQWVAKNSAWYGREGITYSYLTSGSFSARRLEPGTIFDVAGSSLFPEDPLAMLGILNSAAVRQLLGVINPTVNFQVGDLCQLPIPAVFPSELRTEVSRAIEYARQIDCFDETSIDFVQPEPWNGTSSADLNAALERAEQSIDEIAGQLYGMKNQTNPARVRKLSQEDLAKRWISYALGVWFGRWETPAMGSLAALWPLNAGLRRDLGKILADRAGEKAAAEIMKSVGGLDRFLARDFLPWHNLLYRGRPIFWGFAGGEKIVAVYSLNATSQIMQHVFQQIGQILPEGWQRWPDDGIRINLAPLFPWIVDRKLRNALGEIATELDDGQFGFSQTAKWMRNAQSRIER